MNQNDMERYYWRTGQHWSPDLKAKGSRRATVFVLVAFVITSVFLLVQR
jgi:hypothetical protein